MRLSRYTSFVADYPEPGQHLTFNWMTQAMAVLDDELRQLVEAPGSFDAALIPPELAQQLERMGILVEDEVDERQEIEHWHSQVRNNRRTFKAMVMTTYDCNFACTYCVEEGVKRPVKLGHTQAERTVRWIIERMEEQGSEKLYLNFYGGEPLLNVAGLEQVAGPLLAYTQARGLEFDGSVTTNGALLHRRNAERLARVGVTMAKVTLDGDQEAHDQKRPFKGGHGSFELIMRNLEEVWDLIEIRLAGNVDCQNIHAVPKLMNYLEERGLGEKIGGIQFNGISSQARDGFEHHQKGLLQIESPEPLLQIEAVERTLDTPTQSGNREDLFELNHEAAQRGLPARKAITASLCLLNQEENAVVIDPLGKIYKCPALVGHEAFIVGDLSQGEIHYDHLRIYGEDLEGCLDCKWFTVCGGGCRFMSFLKSGDIRHKDCNKEFFDQYGNEMVKMDYEIFLKEHGEPV
ncbi:MAG: SPASM domain-containing protein [Candidatus Latescibacteria bacterium]|nr:SPASM domain-containing protein [Candidatus Latescibacterota bacterium]